MSKRWAWVRAVLAGILAAAGTIGGLAAKGSDPVYMIAEIDVTDLAGYTKEYVPLVQKSLQAAGGKVLAAGQTVTSIEGSAPKSRVVIVRWDSLDQLNAWRDSPQYKEDRKIGDKYATFRIYAIEGRGD
jgi:uncharacterized protein (DUF1330 family)